MSGNLQIVNNHNEALICWRNMKIKDVIIIHIDSHHDIYRERPFVWIDNYLIQAVKENITKEIYLVIPNSFFSNERLNKYINGILGISKIIKKETDFYYIESKDLDAQLYVCSLPRMQKQCRNLSNCIIDIDLDFFIYNGLGSFVNGIENYTINSDFVSSLVILKDIVDMMSPYSIILSKSEFNSYVPFEYQFIVKLIEKYLFNSGEILNLCRGFVNNICNREVICNLDIIPQFLIDDIRYYNACILLNNGNIQDAVKQVNNLTYQIPISKNIASCKYYLYKNNKLAALREAQKFKYFVQNEYLYNFHIALIEQYDCNYNNVVTLLTSHYASCDASALSILAFALIKMQSLTEAKMCIQDALLKYSKYLFPTNRDYVIGAEEFEIRSNLRQLLKLNNELRLF